MAAVRVRVVVTMHDHLRHLVVFYCVVVRFSVVIKMCQACVAFALFL